MKNIHLIPTDKPSRLGRFIDTNNLVLKTFYELSQSSLNIFITSDEEIKEGNYGLIGKEVGKIILTEDGYEFLIGKGVSYEYGDYYSLQKVCKKIILTTDSDLIKDGVQEIDEEYLEWFVKNPSCEEVKIEDYGTLYNFRYLILIPQEELKQECKDCNKSLEDCTCIEDTIDIKEETIEDAAKIWVNNRFTKQICGNESYPDIHASKEGIVESHILFAKCQAKRRYSEEEVKKLFNRYNEFIAHHDIEEWQTWINKQFKKK